MNEMKFLFKYKEIENFSKFEELYIYKINISQLKHDNNDLKEYKKLNIECKLNYSDEIELKIYFINHYNEKKESKNTTIGIYATKENKLINNNNESNYLDNAQIKNETQNNNESFDKYLNDNNKNNIAINYNNEKQENNPKSFYDKKEKRNLIIGNKTQKKKSKSNSITN